MAQFWAQCVSCSIALSIVPCMSDPVFSGFYIYGNLLSRAFGLVSFTRLVFMLTTALSFYQRCRHPIFCTSLVYPETRLVFLPMRWLVRITERQVALRVLRVFGFDAGFCVFLVPRWISPAISVCTFMAQIRAQHFPSDCALYCSLNDFPDYSQAIGFLGRLSWAFRLVRVPWLVVMLAIAFLSINFAVPIDIAVNHSHLVAIDFTPNTRLVLLKMCCYSIISQKDKLHSGILMLNLIEFG